MITANVAPFSINNNNKFQRISAKMVYKFEIFSIESIHLIHSFENRDFQPSELENLMNEEVADSSNI